MSEVDLVGRDLTVIIVFTTIMIASLVGGTFLIIKGLEFMSDNYCHPWWRLKKHQWKDVTENGRVAINWDRQFLKQCKHCEKRNAVGHSHRAN